MVATAAGAAAGADAGAATVAAGSSTCIAAAQGEFAGAAAGAAASAAAGAPTGDGTAAGAAAGGAAAAALADAGGEVVLERAAAQQRAYSTPMTASDVAHHHPGRLLHSRQARLRWYCSDEKRFSECVRYYLHPTTGDSICQSCYDRMSKWGTFLSF